MKSPRFWLAALLVVVGCAACARESRPPQPAYAPIPLSPKGETDWPITFSWTRVPGSEWVYRVTVMDAAERSLMEQETRATTLEAPSDLRPMLVSGGPFTWKVTIVDGDGKPLTQAAPTPLGLK